jgi:hypothetical protein
MIYSAVGLAVIGVAAGLAFRWKLLLLIIIPLPFAVIIFSVFRELSHKDTLIVIFAAEAFLQGGYFIGLLIRFGAAAFIRSASALSVFKRQQDRKIHDNAARTAPSAEVGNGS